MRKNLNHVPPSNSSGSSPGIIPGTSPAPEPILTLEEVAAGLKLKPQTIYELTRRRKGSRALPSFRVGKFLRFRWSEIEKWIAEGRAT